MLEESQSPALDTEETKVSSPKEENNSTNSEPVTDSEDNEISDDDDDDRNHKHRRREARPQSLDDSANEQPLGRPYKKRNRASENGQFFSGTDSQGESQKDYSNLKRRPGVIPLSRAPSDSSSRSRGNQSFRPDPASRTDLSTSAAPRPPMARGRGRNAVPWTQHDPRFSPLDMIDFASQMAPQGPPTHPSLFVGTALPSNATTQNGSWAYGFMPGMGNGILDPIHPLGLQGALQPKISPLIDLGMPRQRCRDFEERGFCLRGDMCPMEHGVNRIVVEDMQSLSQFNLPGSVPNAHGLGIQNETGSAPPISSSSNLLAGSKRVPTKDTKSGVTNDSLKPNGITGAAVGEADVYDPDQPLWNNERPETSCAGLSLPSPNNDDERWNADSSAHEGVGREYANHGFAADIGPQNMKFPIWGRITSKRKPGSGRTSNTNITSKLTAGNQRSNDFRETTPSTVAGKPISTREIAAKTTNGQPNSRVVGDVGRPSNQTSHKASRTLYVNGIPLESNRWEALLAHFQKFGQVIDIYIPSNSEKAFVQFSKREEAEAALKAPDAVMGNRFIKLWWANRDRIPDEGESRVAAKILQVPPTVGSSIPSKPSPYNRGKENLLSTASKVSTGSSSEASGPITGSSKMPPPNGLKAIPSAPKKQESLELLEELRKKQEILAQKRDEFRRQLDKLAKQSTSAASVKKGEAGGKGDVVNDIVKATGPRTINPSTEGTQAEAGCTLEKEKSGDVVASPTSKATTTIAQKTSMVTKQTVSLSAPLNRFKLDNRTTSFRILPPLPTEIADVAVLKDHFSSFGELSSVILEDTEAHNSEATLKPSLSCSACVTYTTRQSAERAFIGGKSCKGHTLRFMWLTASPGSNCRSGPQVTSMASRSSSTEVQPQKVTTGSMSGPAANADAESVLDVVGTKAAPVPISKALVQASCSSSSNADSSSADIPQ